MAAGVLDRGTAATDWQSRVDDFNARYGRALDDGRLADWMAFFTDDAVYKVIAREAYDLGQPMGVSSSLIFLSMESLSDQGVVKKIFHPPTSTS